VLILLDEPVLFEVQARAPPIPVNIKNSNIFNTLDSSKLVLLFMKFIAGGKITKPASRVKIPNPG
jgi:hypothetical protein